MAPPSCLGCQQSMCGKFVSALGGYWHLGCFTCPECKEVVASKFFPVNGRPHCEQHYYASKKLLCHVCQGPIKGANISIGEKRWHPEHFKCSLCDTMLHQANLSTTYFEHEDRPYCALHYSVLFSTPCAGCEMAILDQFVEDHDHKWHVDCYKLFKIWKLKLPPKVRYAPEQELPVLARIQSETKLRVTTTSVILWNLEEEIAQGISEMIVSYDTGNLADCQKKAAIVTHYSEDVFEAINKLFKCGYDHKRVVQADEEQRLAHESDFLCAAIESAFLYISKTADIKRAECGRAPGSVEGGDGDAESKRTTEFINHSMLIAHAFKELISLIISIAFRLESETPSRVSILDVVLFELRFPEGNVRRGDTSQQMLGVTTDKQERRRSTLNPMNLQLPAGFSLPTTPTTTAQLFPRPGSGIVPPPSPPSRQLVDYSIPAPSSDSTSTAPAPAAATTPITPAHPCSSINAAQLNASSSAAARPESDAPPPLQQLPHTAPSQPRTSPLQPQPQPSRPPSVSSLSTLVNSPGALVGSPTTQLCHTHKDSETQNLRSRVRKSFESHLAKFHGAEPPPPPQRDSTRPRSESGDGNGSDGEDDAATLAPPQGSEAAEEEPEMDSRGTSSPAESSLQRDRQRDWEQRELIRFMSDLSALELLMAKQLAVYRLAVLLRGHYSVEKLTAFIQVKSSDLLSKIFGMVRKKRRADLACYGQPLHVAVEKTGVDSKQGSSPGALRIPRVLEEGFTYLERQGLQVKGLFRKAGSETRMVVLRDRLGKSAQVEYGQFKPHDVSNNIKRFLRELPEPLLTFPLHDLFLSSQKFPDPEVRREIVHLATVLLPKHNRDVLEVLCTFLRKLADHADGGQGGGDADGNLMTTKNLATVVAPTVMFSERDKERAAQQHREPGACAASTTAAAGSTAASPPAPRKYGTLRGLRSTFEPGANSGKNNDNKATSPATQASTAPPRGVGHSTLTRSGGEKAAAAAVATAAHEHEDDTVKASVSVLVCLIDNAYAFAKVPPLLLSQLSKPHA